MRLELTPEQEAELRRETGVEVVEPGTQAAFVLIAREQFDRVRHVFEAEAPETFLSMYRFWCRAPA